VTDALLDAVDVAGELEVLVEHSPACSSIPTPRLPAAPTPRTGPPSPTGPAGTASRHCPPSRAPSRSTSPTTRPGSPDHSASSAVLRSPSRSVRPAIQSDRSWAGPAATSGGSPRRHPPHRQPPRRAEHVAPLAGRRVVVAFDNDHAGQRVALTTWPLLRQTGAVPDLAGLHAAPTPPSSPARLPPGCAVLSTTRSLEDLVVDARLAGWSSQLRCHEGQIGALHDVAHVVREIPPDRVARQVGRLASASPSRQPPSPPLPSPLTAAQPSCPGPRP
jgi:hypothetical protein